MNQDDTFSFRWGIPILDSGHTDIPNFFLDNYAAAGVSRQEFLVIIHLARYQYNMPESECRPSIGTVSRQLGITKRSLQRILASLEERGLLARYYRSGQTTVYDFSGFSHAIVTWIAGDDASVTPDASVMGGDDASVMGGMTPVSPKEEELKEETVEEKEVVAGSLAEDVVMCSIHNKPMAMRKKGGKMWYSHRLPDGTWCKGTTGDVASDDGHVSDRQKYAEWRTAQ